MGHLATALCIVAFTLFQACHGFVNVNVSSYEEIQGEPKPEEIEIRAPGIGVLGADVILECFWNNPGKVANRLVWRKDGEMIFVYSRTEHNVPEEEKRVYLFQGIHVDDTKSNARQLYLRNITWTTEGMYECEFFTGTSKAAHSKHHMLYVVDGLDPHPRLKGFPTVIRANETIHGTCSIRTKVSYNNWAEDIRIAFLINGEPVEDSYDVDLNRTIAHKHGRTLITEILTLIIEPNHFTDIAMEGRQLKLTCVVTKGNHGSFFHVSQDLYDADDVSNRWRLSASKTTGPPCLHKEIADLVESASGDAASVIVTNSTTNATDNAVPAKHLNLREILRTLMTEMEKQTKIQQQRLDLEQKRLELKKEEFHFVKRHTPPLPEIPHVLS